MSLPVFSSKTPAFKQWLNDLLAQRSVLGDGVEGAVASIVEAVRERGDQALIELTERYDHATLTTKATASQPQGNRPGAGGPAARSTPGLGDGGQADSRISSPHGREIIHLS